MFEPGQPNQRTLVDLLTPESAVTRPPLESVDSYFPSTFLSERGSRLETMSSWRFLSAIFSFGCRKCAYGRYSLEISRSGERRTIGLRDLSYDLNLWFEQSSSEFLGVTRQVRWFWMISLGHLLPGHIIMLHGKQTD